MKLVRSIFGRNSWFLAEYYIIFFLGLSRDSHPSNSTPTIFKLPTLIILGFSPRSSFVSSFLPWLHKTASSTFFLHSSSPHEMVKSSVGMKFTMLSSISSFVLILHPSPTFTGSYTLLNALCSKIRRAF